MMYQERNNFLKIPILSNIYAMHPLSKMYFVDSVARVRNGDNYQDFYGHSASCDPIIAKNKSYYEILERVLASQIFFDKNDISRKFIGRCFFNKNPIKEYDYKDILIRTEFSVSASGLGLHSDEKLAIEHAIFEVIERHVALLLWCKDNEIMLINSRELADGYFIYNYTSILKIPFCVSVIINKKEDIFFCGLSVKSNLNDAIKAAEVEALSLLGNILIKNTNKPKAFGLCECWQKQCHQGLPIGTIRSNHGR